MRGLAYYGVPCVDTAVDRYLLGGDLPAKDITCTKSKSKDKSAGKPGSR